MFEFQPFKSFDSKVSFISPFFAGGVLCVAYLSLVRLLRWRRYDEIHAKYQAKYDSGTLTAEEAQRIMAVSSLYDMPLLLNYSLAFALFKTYGVPSISKLLMTTKQLTTKDNVSKRYADTEVMISTWVGCPISGFAFDSKLDADDKAQPDPRAMIALARVNWLHSKYSISNGDFLYTLCLFTLEPATWAERFGWRSLSPLERHAYYTFWAEIGRRMGIRDIPGSYEGMKIWSINYEISHMVPDLLNKMVAAHTTDELLYAVPEVFGIRKFAQRITVCLLEDRVRVAMMQPKQPFALKLFTLGLMKSIGLFQRWFLLPRKHGHFRFPVDINMPCSPRMIPKKWTAKPWYRPEATGLWHYWDKLLVSLGWFSEMPGSHLRSSGYRLEEMGPLNFESDGQEEVIKRAEDLLGCPITGAWARSKKRTD